MSFQGVKRFFIDKQYVKKKQNCSRQNKKLERTIKSIVVLGEDEDLLNFPKSFSSEIKRNINNIEYVKFSEKREEKTPNFGLFDFNLWGKIKNDRLQNLVDKEFDLLVNLVKDNTTINYVSLLSKAKFKISVFQQNQTQYDFMIDQKSTNWDEFNFELKKYIDILNN